MEFGLFEKNDDKIESIEIVNSDNNVMVFKAKLKDGTDYFMPVDLSVSMDEVINNLLGKMDFKFPKNSEDIRVYCEKIINFMTNYYTLKVFKRKLLFIDKGIDEEAMAYLDNILDIAEKKIKNILAAASTLTPLWFGNRVNNLPMYFGDNPYNIHGVDHKYDYLLKSDEKYLSKRRDLILWLATSKTPINISEQGLIECTPLINFVNSTKLSKDEEVKEEPNQPNENIVNADETTIDKTSPVEETSKDTDIHEKTVNNDEVNIEKIKPVEQTSKDTTIQGTIDARFLDELDEFVKKYNEYATMASGDTMYIDTDFCTRLLDTADYLFDQLNIMKDSINNDDYIRYAMFLEEYHNKLSKQLEHLNKASSVFVR